jgi:hypothetical protein
MCGVKGRSSGIRPTPQCCKSCLVFCTRNVAHVTRPLSRIEFSPPARNERITQNEHTECCLPVHCSFRAVIPYWSSLSFSAVLTVRFQIDFPALAARLAFATSTSEPPVARTGQTLPISAILRQMLETGGAQQSSPRRDLLRALLSNPALLQGAWFKLCPDRPDKAKRTRTKPPSMRCPAKSRCGIVIGWERCHG